jgi:NAD(P)H dehydrogenase (quinone)
MTVAVTGATGHLGGLVVQHLLARGTAPDQIVALVRDPGRATTLAAAGVTVRAFDYDQPETLASALAGVESLLLVSGTAFGQRLQQHRAVIDAAKAAGVGRVLYTSSPVADESINPVAPEHKATEEYLASSGVPHVVLRNGWYHENYVQTLQAAAQTGEVLTAAGDGQVASAARTDYAEAAAVVLLSEGAGRVYELGGDVAWTFDELAAQLTGLLGREIVVHRVSAAEEVSLLTAAGLDAGTAGFVAGVDAAIAAGELGRVTGELSSLIGHPTAPIIDTLRAAL